MEAFLLALLVLSSSAIVRGIRWNGNWAFDCDFPGNDLTSMPSSLKNCKRLCEDDARCSHYTWSEFKGGLCKLKSGKVSKLDAVDTSNNGMMCAIVKSGAPRKAQAGVGRVLQNVLATRHVNGGGDACALPRANYANNYPFALGNIGSLEHLKFKPDLCGHILTINCGRGPLDVIIVNSNLGGGLDLYSRSTW